MKSVKPIVQYFSIFILIIKLDASPCMSKDCSGPFTMNINPIIFNSQNPKEIQGESYIVNPKAKLKTIFKRKMIKYCYNGGSMDGNTGCLDSSEPVRATIAEFESNSCLVGPTVKPGDAWGLDASICLNYKMHNVDNKEPEIFNWVGSAPFANHMCVMDWECKTHISAVDVHLNAESYLDIYTWDQDGRELYLGKVSNGTDSFTKETYKDGFSNQYLINSSIEYSTFLAVCFNVKENPICTITQSLNKNLIGLAIRPDNRGTDVIKNKYFKLYEKMVNSHTEHLHYYMEKAASVSDVAMVTSELILVMEETHYNVALLLEKVNILHNILNKVINSVGKVDDELLPNILDKNGKTKWLNREIFNICPCYDTQQKRESNCNNGYLYKDGRLTKITEENKNECTQYDIEEISKLDYMDNMTLSINTLVFPPPEGTSSTWDGWSWISNVKSDIISSVTLFGKNQYSGGIIDEISGFSSFANKFLFIFSTSFLTYINSILLVMLFVYKCR